MKAQEHRGDIRRSVARNADDVGEAGVRNPQPTCFPRLCPIPESTAALEAESGRQERERTGERDQHSPVLRLWDSVWRQPVRFAELGLGSGRRLLLDLVGAKHDVFDVHFVQGLHRFAYRPVVCECIALQEHCLLRVAGLFGSNRGTEILHSC